MLPNNDVTADEYWEGSFGVNHCDNIVVFYGKYIAYFE